MDQLPTEAGTQAPPLSDRIEAAIAAVRNVEHILPLVVIVHDIRNWHVCYMSKSGRNYLNTTNEALRELGTEYFSLYFNSEDARDYVPQILGLLERNNDEELISFFQQVRKSPEHDWSWFLSSVKILLRDAEGQPVLTLTAAIPVDAQHHIAAKAQRLLEENNFLRHNYHVFDQVTRQEKEVLKRLTLGQSSAEIAAALHISEATANTHRRNLKNKLKAKTNYDLSMFARAFDLI